MDGRLGAGVARSAENVLRLPREPPGSSFLVAAWPVQVQDGWRKFRRRRQAVPCGSLRRREGDLASAVPSITSSPRAVPRARAPDTASPVTPLPSTTRRRTFFAGTLGLNRRTRRRAVGTENAAIARLRPQPHPAAGAFIKEPAGVGRHGFRLRGSAMRTSNHGLKDHGEFSRLPGVQIGCTLRACRGPPAAARPRAQKNNPPSRSPSRVPAPPSWYRHRSRRLRPSDFQ
jgi:hypothetical protein